MHCLALDTAAQFCAAAVFDTANDTLVAQTTRDIGRGHAEILMDVITVTLADADLEYSDLGRVVATSGPGSFTGIRVGLATARGIALGLSIPVYGVSTLEAAHAAARPLVASGIDGVLAVLDARRDEAFCQYFGKDTELSAEPFAASYEAIHAILHEAKHSSFALCGSGAGRINELSRGKYAVLHEFSAAPIEVVAELGAKMPKKRQNSDPVYLRSADAKPQIGFALPRA